MFVDGESKWGVNGEYESITLDVKFEASSGGGRKLVVGELVRDDKIEEVFHLEWTPEVKKIFREAYKKAGLGENVEASTFEISGPAPTKEAPIEWDRKAFLFGGGSYTKPRLEVGFYTSAGLHGQYWFDLQPVLQVMSY